MANRSDIPWEKLYYFILSCGSIHEPYQFSIHILEELKELCSFDQALILFLNGNGKICNQYLMNIDDQWLNMYLGYYSKINHDFYQTLYELRETYNKPFISFRPWSQSPSSNEFLSDYIRPLGVKCSLGFVLFDINGMPRTIFALDKTKEEKFSDSELALLSLAIPQLNNLHKNFYSKPSRHTSDNQELLKTACLTEREKDIADLLCQGLSPAHISKSLHIALSTTNRHISNIYKKMHVSSRQELLVRLLDREPE